MDRGAWWVTVHRVTGSQTQLSDQRTAAPTSLLSASLSCLFVTCTLANAPTPESPGPPHQEGGGPCCRPLRFCGRKLTQEERTEENGQRVLTALCPGMLQKRGSTASTLTAHTFVSKDDPIVRCHSRLFVVHSLSRVRLSATPWTAARQASLSFTNSRSLLKLMSIEAVMPSNHLILCLPLLLPPSIFPSIRVVSSEFALCIRWPKDWRFSFSISASSEYSELISFRMDWLDLLAVQGTLKSLLQRHSSKASVVWCSVFFYFQLSHPYTTVGKITAFDY